MKKSSQLLKALLGAVVLILAWHQGCAWAQSEAISATCPHGQYVNRSGVSDGCSTAPVGKFNNKTLIQHPEFFNGYANQNGQSYRTRPAWNVAGVDYPVGIPAGTVLKDPATATLPPHCNYKPTGSSLGGPVVSCLRHC